MNCGQSFRGTDGLKHICDLRYGHPPGHPGEHYCFAHNIHQEFKPTGQEIYDHDTK